MTQYKLYYFNVRARGELIRVIFNYAGIQFEDIRFNYEDWLSTYKSKMIFGQAPVLEVDGQELAQSFTIARYLARMFGIAGKDAFEEAQADMYVDCISDLMAAFFPSFREKDPAKKQEMNQKFLETVARPYLERIEKHLVDKSSPYLVGDKLTWADLAHWDFFEFLTGKFGDFLTDFPQFKSLMETIDNIPRLKKMVSKRPVFEI